MRIRCITYGEQFDATKFKPIKNHDFVKPDGGLWASPVDSDYGWYDWCKQESFGRLDEAFEFIVDGNVFVIDGCEDANRMKWLRCPSFPRMSFPDFEALVAEGYDAVLLTVKGERETRFGKPSLYGWDCETVLVLNPDCIIDVAPSNQAAGREKQDGYVGREVGGSVFEQKPYAGGSVLQADAGDGQG